MNSRFMRQLARALRLLPLLLSSLSCATAPQLYTQNPLATEIIRARAGHDGKLTNQTCAAYTGSVCSSWTVKEYDLSDQNFRTEINTLGFICNLSGHRYKICPDRAGLCRTSYSCQRFLGVCYNEVASVEFVPATPYQVLIDGNLSCFNENIYPFDYGTQTQ